MPDWKWITIVIMILVVGGVLTEASRSRRSDTARYKRVELMNSSEHAVLLALREAAPAHIVVLAKVRVADLINPIGNNISAFNRIAKKHVDFVLYHAQTRQVLAAIELDGPTHSSSRAQASDKLKNSCFASAQLRLVRLPLAGAEEAVRTLFLEFQSTRSSAESVRLAALPTAGPSGRIERWQRVVQAAPASPSPPADARQTSRSSQTQTGDSTI